MVTTGSGFSNLPKRKANPWLAFLLGITVGGAGIHFWTRYALPDSAVEKICGEALSSCQNERSSLTSENNSLYGQREFLEEKLAETEKQRQIFADNYVFAWGDLELCTAENKDLSAELRFCYGTLGQGYTPERVCPSANVVERAVSRPSLYAAADSVCWDLKDAPDYQTFARVLRDEYLRKVPGQKVVVPAKPEVVSNLLFIMRCETIIPDEGGDVAKFRQQLQSYLVGASFDSRKYANPLQHPLSGKTGGTPVFTFRYTQ